MLGPFCQHTCSFPFPTFLSMDPPPVVGSTSVLPKSFVYVLGNTCIPAVIPLRTPSTHRGELALFFRMRMLHVYHPLQICIDWEIFSWQASDLWHPTNLEAFGLKSTFSAGLLDNKHVLLRFNNEEDNHRIWLREHLYLRNYPMRVFKWTPDAKMSIAPIWVCVSLFIFLLNQVYSP